MSEGRDRGPGGPVPGERLFRALLVLHPPAFRRRWRSEMVALFREGWLEEAAGRGAWATARYSWRATWGTVVVATRQRLGLEGDAPRPAGRGSHRRRERGDDGTSTGGGGMGGWLQDLGFAARALRRRPAFAALVVATFALGMGANTAVFSVLHGVLLSPLPYDGAERLVRLYSVEEVEPDDLQYVPGMWFIELRERTSSVELVALYNYTQESADLTDGDRPERVRTLRVGSGYFDLLGSPPMLGRGFRPDEERDSAFVAVVREDVWRRYLDADPEAVGRASVTLDGVPHTVVGVAPDAFGDPLDEGVDVWVPQDLRPGGGNSFGNYYLTVLGRLAPGATLEQARAEVTAVSRRFTELSEEAEGQRARLVPLRDDVVGDAGTLLYVVMAAAGLLLLVACVNVASLFLVRGASLRKELAIRAALGSGRGRLARRVLLESVLLSAVGGAAGLLLGIALLEGLLAVAPPDLPRLAELAVDGPVLVVGAAVSLVAGTLFGLGPAVRYSRPADDTTLSDEVRGAGARPPRQRARNTLVVAEVALALVLLVGAGVLLRSFHELRTLDLGFDAAGVQTFEVHLPDGRYADPADRARFHAALHERLEALPGVVRAGAISDLPVTGDRYRWGTGLSDAAGERDFETFVGANQRAVEGDYFETVGIPLIGGRSFGPGDHAESPHVVVVNESLVGRLWPDRGPEAALGRDLWYGPWQARVVGVVGDAAIGPRGEGMPKVYHAHRQFADNRNWSMVHLLRTRGSLPDLAATLRREVAGLDPLLVVAGVRPLADVAGRGVARERFAALLLTVFSTVAGLLAAVGIYGVLAYSVARRRREIGVRVALGAGAASVRGMVVGQGLRLALVGVGLGLAGALVLARGLSSLLFRVSPTDPWIYSGVAAGVLAVALLASWLPAFRATRLDPTEALRAE